MQNEEIDLTPYKMAIRKRFRAVLVWLVIGLVVAEVITMVVPPMWRVNAVLLVPQGGGDNPLTQLLKSDTDPLEIMKGVLQSKSTLDLLSSKTGLSDRDCDKLLNIQTKKDQSQIIITASDWDNKLATTIVNGSLEALKKITDAGQLSLADVQTAVLRDDLARRNKALTVLEDKLLHFSANAKTPVDPTNPFSAGVYVQKKKEAEYELKMVDQTIKVALDSAQKMSKVGLQLPTAIPNQERLREQLVSQQYQLDTKMTQLGSANADVKNLQAQIQVTKDLIQKEVTGYVKAANQGIDPELAQLFGQQLILKFQNDYMDSLAKAAPKEALDASRLFREIAMQEDAIKFVREKLEESKVNGLVNPTQWSILDPTYTEDKPANKRFGLFGSLGGLVGLLIGCAAAILKDLREGKRNGSSYND